MPIHPDLLAILVCPQSRAPLIEDGDWLVSTDRHTRRRYPVRDGIPVMLIEESQVLPEDTWRALMERMGQAT